MITYFLKYFADPHGLNGLNFEGRPSEKQLSSLVMGWYPLTLLSILKETYILLSPKNSISKVQSTVYVCKNKCPVVYMVSYFL